MSEGYIPRRGSIIVRVEERDIKTAQGIILPDNKKMIFITGTIAQVGEGRTLENGTERKMFGSVGDRIKFSKDSVVPLSIDGKLVLMDDEAILCKIIEPVKEVN